jgi:hypothetical protein
MEWTFGNGGAFFFAPAARVLKKTSRLSKFDQTADCTAKTALSRRRRLVAEEHDENQLLRISVPSEIIHQAIWLYLRFALSFRDVEDLLAQRGIAISYETIRRWVNHFGPIIATELHKRRPKPHSTWHLDEGYLKIDGRIAKPIAVWITPTPSRLTPERASPPSRWSPGCIRCLLDRRPGRAARKHGGDPCKAVGVFSAASIQAGGLALGNPLRLPAAAVVIVLTGDGGEHIKHHRIQRREHAPGEIVGRTRQHPTRRKIEPDDADLLGVKIGAELLPIPMLRRL